MTHVQPTALAVFIAMIFATATWATEGSPTRGQRVFGVCAACHSLQSDQNMTGPSLANLWNRKAGSVATFDRYSPALKSASITWNDKTLNDWIRDPQHLVPGNQMTFAGIEDARQRADLLAFLKDATKPGASIAQQSGSMGGMGGMMGGGAEVPDLKKLPPANRVQEITYCKDTYTVVTADGQTRKFWERSLRLMSDASARGPEQHAPALLRAGMMGDRADVIFANPSEISPFIAAKC